MTEYKQEMIDEDSSKIFVGIRFVLAGSDSPKKQQIRTKLLEGGGAEVIGYGPHCTHLIVHGIIYDDPICDTARRDGKILVTSLWVEHSFDAGMPVDHLSIMFRPPKDLNGIPAAESLVMCLTRYQRQDRDDIMTMVGLMGAHFSKPLAALKVTHLICYKFEGEKYELAKKMRRIKLVNHRWLEDCLIAWEILPEAGYDKSGYELEMMEAEAKDSEDEKDYNAANMGGERVSFTSPQHSKSPSQFRVKQEISRNISEIHTPTGLSDLRNSQQLVLCASDKSKLDLVTALEESNQKHIETFGTTVSRNEEVLHSMPQNSNSPASVSSSAKMSPNSYLSNRFIKSYSRKKPKRVGLTMVLDQSENAGSPPSSKVIKHGDNMNISSEKEQDGPEIGFAKDPRGNMSCLDKGQSGILPEERRVDMLYSSTNSPKTSHYPESMLDHDLVEDRDEELDRHLSFQKNIHFDKGALPLKTCDSSISNPTKLGNQLECDEDVLQAGTCVVLGLEKPTLTSKMDLMNYQACETEHSIGEHNGPSNELQAVKSPCPQNEREDVEKSIRLAKLENAVGDSVSGSKPSKGKSLSEKTLGSRVKICKEDTSNKKGAIFLVQTENDTAPLVSRGRKDGEHKEILTSAKVEVPRADNAESSKETEERKYLDCGKKDIKTAENADAKSPENKEPDENVSRSECSEAPGLAVTSTANKLIVNQLENQTDVEDCAVRHDTDNKNSEARKTISGKKTGSKKSTAVEDDAGVKVTKGPKYLMKRRETTIAAKRAVISAKGSRRKKSKIDKMTETEKAKVLPVTGEATELASDHELNSMDAEKENIPVTEGQSTSYNGHGSGKFPRCDDLNSVATLHPLQVTGVGTEPRWFILSGHRLQRKEFQKVIKSLKGNVCRDSHQWSYQATHFIVPEPIRRTEKFFAAAASGRWILKTDYLTASNQAGRLLDEELYEWHKKGLTEDLAIDLEAPQKWRLLRERTGHGAFYQMKIIIYGDCIVPPLDTLKRAVKAGDGTILATSPPYTRFLKSGLDFAIVDEATPHYDMWVQEFLKHEIPCILPDYLVAYVCKPSYPRENYVKYNTHAWVEKSLNNHANRLEEVAVDLVPSDRNSNNISIEGE